MQMFYTFTCTNCKIFEKMLNSILLLYSNKFEFKKILANSPMGFIRTTKLGIHSVPIILIENKIVWREVPEKQELINKLNNYL